MPPPSLGHDSSSDDDAPTPAARLVPSTGVALQSAVRDCAQMYAEDAEEDDKEDVEQVST